LVKSQKIRSGATSYDNEPDSVIENMDGNTERTEI